MPLPAYLPFEPGPHRHRVGTRTLDPARWVEEGRLTVPLDRVQAVVERAP